MVLLCAGELVQATSLLQNWLEKESNDGQLSQIGRLLLHSAKEQQQATLCETVCVGPRREMIEDGFLCGVGDAVLTVWGTFANDARVLKEWERKKTGTVSCCYLAVSACLLQCQ